MSNINSFSENMTQLTASVADAMAMLSGYNESAISSDSSTKVTLIDGSTIELPSYSNVIKRVDRAENTIASFVKGNGLVETDDNTFRKIKVSTVPKSPTKIKNVGEVSTFNIDSNWFFEDFMFPKCVVEIDLKNKIDDDSDRVYINRVILDYTTSYNGVDVSTYYANNIQNKNISYPSLIEKLNNDGISYYEDQQTVQLPLYFEKYKGDFTITQISQDGGKLWYYLDTCNYKQVDINGVILSSSYLLSTDDYIRYNDSLYKITEIDQKNKRVTIDYSVGYETPSVGGTFYYYNTPFTEKIVKISIGFNEINILYIKGVNEEYNILGEEWSDPITYTTNDLKFSSTGMTLAEYYPKYILDIGSEWIAKAKQNTIYAFNGKTPNTPAPNAADFKVVQINTQLNATLDTETYKNIVSDIVSTKSNIEDLRKNIATNKETLTTESSASKRETIQNTINSDTNSLSKYTTQYNSLVTELNTLLNESGAIGYTPKYHVRGFFPIPAPVYTDDTLKTGKQEVIGFDIMYRYIHTDDTGVDLNTFKYTDTNNNINAVFSDWNEITSKLKEQIYDDNLGVYIWKDDDVSDSTAININQIDLPLRSGEKLQFKIRSISEAGYPTNPLKSEWSDNVTISFPDNLSSNDSVTNILESAKNDLTSVVLQETLSSAGLYSHISDSVGNYKHDTKNIYHTYYDTSAAKVVTTSLDILLNKLMA